MRSTRSNFQKFILPTILGGVFSLIGCLMTCLFTENKQKLVSREVTETKNHDGSVTRRRMEIYK